MTLPEALMSLLNEQVSGYTQLLDLLQKERACLVDLNAECIEELAKGKDTLILKLRLLEGERVRLVRDIAGGDVTLESLGHLTGNRLFLEVRSKLISLLQGIEELNAFNKVLLERSLSYVRNASQFLSFYGVSSPRQGKGALISGEI